MEYAKIYLMLCGAVSLGVLIMHLWYGYGYRRRSEISYRYIRGVENASSDIEHVGEKRAAQTTDSEGKA